MRRTQLLSLSLRDLASLLVGGYTQDPPNLAEVLFRLRIHLLTETDRGHLLAHVQDLMDRLGYARRQTAPLLAALCSSPSVIIASVTSLQTPQAARSRALQPVQGQASETSGVPAGEELDRAALRVPSAASSAAPPAWQRGDPAEEDPLRSSFRLRAVRAVFGPPGAGVGEAAGARGAGGVSEAGDPYRSSTRLRVVAAAGGEARAGRPVSQASRGVGPAATVVSAGAGPREDTAGIERRLSTAVIYRQMLERPAVQRQREQIRVLVVEDDFEQREFFARRVRAGGYQVESAGDGLEALALLRQRTFGLVVLELKLRGLHGLELLNMMAKASPRVPVVVCTSHSDLVEFPQVRTYGPLRVCPKPDDGRRLLGFIDELARIDLAG